MNKYNTLPEINQPSDGKNAEVNKIESQTKKGTLKRPQNCSK